MKSLKFLLSLITRDNDYQRAQAAAAEIEARKLGIELQIVYADNDGIEQSQQLLQAVQSSSRPDGIIFEPAGTGLIQVARAATTAGIAWVTLNKAVDTITEIRKQSKVPVFAISSDNEEVGRIQGRQFGALLPEGGTILYIEGPGANAAAQQRTVGMNKTKPTNIQVRMLRGHWTEQSGHQAVTAWLRLPTSRQLVVGLIASQNDSMAVGAHKAIEDHASVMEREKLLQLPFTGCDGVPNAGQAWVRRGLLRATVITPTNAGIAIEMLTQALQTGIQPPEHTIIKPLSYPPIDDLAPRANDPVAASSPSLVGSRPSVPSRRPGQVF